MAKFTRIAHLSLMYIRLRSTDSLHKKFCRITSYDAAAGGLLGSLCLGLLAQLCRHAHGQLLSEWAVNGTVKKERLKALPSAACWLSSSRSLQPDGDQLPRVGVALLFPLGLGQVTTREEEDHQRREEHRRRRLERQVLSKLSSFDARREVAGE